MLRQKVKMVPISAPSAGIALSGGTVALSILCADDPERGAPPALSKAYQSGFWYLYADEVSEERPML
jgi:hypothetical protein